MHYHNVTSIELREGDSSDGGNYAVVYIHYRDDDGIDRCGIVWAHSQDGVKLRNHTGQTKKRRSQAAATRLALSL